MSKYKRYDDAPVRPHKHCAARGCWNMISEDATYCSKECEERSTQKQQRSKKGIFAIVGVYAAFIVVFVVIAFL